MMVKTKLSKTDADLASFQYKVGTPLNNPPVQKTPFHHPLCHNFEPARLFLTRSKVSHHPFPQLGPQSFEEIGNVPVVRLRW
jgi:hypothetical protein